MMSRKFMITGSRHWTNPEPIIRLLRSAEADGFDILIHGGALGADSVADHHWMKTTMVIKADWGRLKKKAGPERNQRLLKLGPEFVVGFPWGRYEENNSRGTYNAMLQAVRAGIKTYMYDKYDGVFMPFQPSDR